MHEKKLNLDDDFIKFLRWAQYWVDQADRGVVALVTNSTYLAGVTHRRMRKSLTETFDQIYVLDLHGNRKKRETSPGGATDENVFPIQQGVAIGLFVKTGRGTSQARHVFHSELWGSREAKLNVLSNSDVAQTNWTTLEPSVPFHFFVPRRDQHAEDYREWPRLDDIFQQYVSGVQTKWDALFVGYTHEEVATRLKAFLHDAGRGHFASEVPAWLQSKARQVEFDARLIRRYMVAPLDVRWVYYDPRLLGRARHRLLQHLDTDNIALVFMRQATNPNDYDHFLVTNMLVSDRVFYSAHGAPFVAPLYAGNGGQRRVNLNPDFVERLARRLGVPFAETKDESPESFGARDILHWLYAVVCTRWYRERYYSLLCIDFPRIAWPDNLEHFRRLRGEGKALAKAQLDVMSTRPSAGGATRVRQGTKALGQMV